MSHYSIPIFKATQLYYRHELASAAMNLEGLPRRAPVLTVSTNWEHAMQLGLIGLGGIGNRRARRVSKHVHTPELVEYRQQVMAFL